MSIRELYRLWRDTVELGLGEIRLGLEMIRDAKRK
jgi:hypothetical protein